MLPFGTYQWLPLQWAQSGMVGCGSVLVNDYGVIYIRMYSCKLIGGTVGAYDTSCSLFCLVVAFVQPRNAAPPSPPPRMTSIKWCLSPLAQKHFARSSATVQVAVCQSPTNMSQDPLNRHGAFLGDPHKRR